MKSFVLFFAGLVVGASLVLFIKSSAINEISPSMQQIVDTHDRLKRLSEREYQDYLALKDDAEKFKAADELLGKVMVLFLADLSMKLQNPSAENHVLKPEPINTTETVTPKIESVSAAPAQESQPVAAQVAWKNNDIKIMTSSTEKEVAEQLAKNEIKNLKPEIHTAVTLSQKQLDLIQGKYEGVVTFFDPNSKPWRVDWEVDAQIVNGQPKGNTLIALANDVKVFSRSTGDGSLKNFESFAGDTQAILVNAYGDDGYFQLYRVEALNKLVGNYYQKVDKKSDDFKRLGIVSLSKIK